MVGFPSGLAGKESACNAGDLGSIPGLGRSPVEGKGYSLQYSGLENSMDRRAWQAVVHGSQRVGDDQNFHTFFLSLTPTAVYQRVLSVLLQECIFYFLWACLSPLPLPLSELQHLLPRVSHSLPTDLPASSPFSPQQPDGTSSKQNPWDGHRALLSRPAHLFGLSPLLTLLPRSWPPFCSLNTLGLVVIIFFFFLILFIYLLFGCPTWLAGS